MVGSGTLVNTIAVGGGGIVGYLFQRIIPVKVQETVLKALGLGVFFIGLAGTLSKMLLIKNGSVSTTGEIMLIISLAIGTVFGELIDIDKWLNQFGKYLAKHFGSTSSSKFSEGFLVTTLTTCVGALAVVGALQDGLNHDPSILYTKSTIDFITVILFAASFGIGCAFAAIPIFVVEGGITLLAVFVKAFMTTNMLTGISLVGDTLIALIGINMMLGTKIKIANMLPALIVVVFYVPFFGIG